MSRVKEVFIQQHERLMGDYLDANPNATDEEAYEATSGAAFDSLGDYFADMADYYRDLAKDRGL